MQLIVQMQTQLADDPSSTNILKKPEHILSFVKHALDSAIAELSSSESYKPTKRGLNLESFRIVDDSLSEDEDLYPDADSDDERDDALVGESTADDEILPTAINLLLAILEGHSSSFIIPACLLNLPS